MWELGNGGDSFTKCCRETVINPGPNTWEQSLFLDNAEGLEIEMTWVKIYICYINVWWQDCLQYIYSETEWR